jgi:hypothetical protein
MSKRMLATWGWCAMCSWHFGSVMEIDFQIWKIWGCGLDTLFCLVEMQQIHKVL